ncbi:ABC transporter ATP-binding protein [Deinococcus cellulosilyticus]|uniref:ABC transporter ATP-binding protein n=1 Tax=Deinococcus cellulosilyticus (strain DSM 18568 / NBRC 106333 / KACC 11606 / 5516J-15) TaxID=1223518 RepID=A0A511N4T6_DEIC1|nr:ABC transporter ATP-binding protein [Deinococcus cellulosilyticus]GEM47869.1 ABC transporter ATP-binding protein [Deinococcus cellulosilyticus NBRC 106333 = KACC 11606]
MRNLKEQHYFLERFQGSRPIQTFLFLYEGQGSRLFWSFLLYVIKVSPAVLLPIITARVVDVISTRAPLQHLWMWAVVMAILLVQNIPNHYLHVRYLSMATRTMENRLRAAICRHLQHLSIGFYNRTSAGSLQNKVLRDVEAIEQLTRILFDTGLGALVFIVVALVTTAIRAPEFILFYVVTVPAAALLVRSMRGALSDHNSAFRKELEAMSARIMEMTSLIPITRAHGLEDQELKRVSHTLDRVKEAGVGLDSINAMFNAVAWVTFNVFNMGCLIVAGYVYYVQLLPITVGDVVMLSGFFGSLTNAVINLINLVPQMSKGLEAIRSIGEVLESPDLEHNSGKAVVKGVRGEFTFQEVCFQYPDEDQHAIRHFNLTVKAGETVALVGPSGSGKSTILSLVIGFNRATCGKILLDGKNMEELDLRTYRRFLSVVPQESLLFEGSIRDNVTYGLGKVDEDRLLEALKDANAWEFIERLPEGLETRVGEKGARLSGGQKQRLAIARALIRNPRVLILDEATSALDTESEHLIQEALERLMKGRTTFVVAHRLSTVRNADRIVVLAQGKIEEVGPHQTLLEQQGLYAQLYNRQAGVHQIH